MFRPEKRGETIGMLIGVGVLALGIALLLVAFSIAWGIARNPADYVASLMPQPPPAEPAGPRAAFRWTADGLTANFNENSTPGDASIATWFWDFGDGGSSGERNPQHTFALQGTYFVRLTVRDGNSKESSGVSNVQALPGVQSGGNSAADIGDITAGFDLSAIAAPLVNLGVGIAAVVATFMMLTVMAIVGGSITKAGWNLIRPRPETIRVRIKPKHLEAEPVEPALPPPPPVPPPPAP